MKGYLLRLFFVVGLLLPGMAWAQDRTITGRVMDENRSPLAGASVQVKDNTNIGVTTDGNGRYSISVPDVTGALVFSFVGMDEKEVALRPNSNVINVTLSGGLVLEEVVVNAGIITRDAATFTGSVKTVSQAELKQAGTMNVLTALSSLDPSFVIVPNNLTGSDPNAMMTVELNGKTTANFYTTAEEITASANNPNQPLFVLDGFETSMQKIMDMDINRIESVTVLKDAGSTAIYGSKGANGVVVVETVKPKPGELMIDYNLNLKTEFADLSVYNLMNARQKLDFEAESGYYDTSNTMWNNPANPKFESYQSVLAQIERGVDTYWLKYPVRTGITHAHALTVSGGDGKLNYSVNAGFTNHQGVMKGSSRQNVTGGVFLQYRVGALNVTNDMNFSSTAQHSGSYGSFQTWAYMSPYYKPYDDEGRVRPNANDTGTGGFVANPMWNARLSSDYLNKMYDFRNNTRFEYMLPDLGLRFYGGLSLSRSGSNGMNYKDAAHTDFRSMAEADKGSATYSTSSQWSYSAHIAARLSRTFGEGHNFTLHGRAQVDNNNMENFSTNVRGLPQGTMPNPSMGEYPPNSKPTFMQNIHRGADFLLTLNYNYMQRYLSDFTLQHMGATTFGKDNPFTTNWSIGLGWNIHREAFAENWTWTDNMKLRGSVGTSANQNFTIIPQNIYDYVAGSNYYGMFWVLNKFANPYVDWAKTTNISVGLDLTLLNDRLNATVDLYSKKTDPMVISLPYPPSSGQTGYDTNMGYTKTIGWTASLSYNILRRPEDRLVFNVFASAGSNRTTYGGVGEAFKLINEQLANSLNIDIEDEDGNPILENIEKVNQSLLNNMMLRRYYDGADADALWAVRSLGIDPATGREVYMTKDGKPTFAYNFDDAVEIGSSRPKLLGTFGLTFNWKNLRSNIIFGYSLGGHVVDQALFNKVENITFENILRNQDKRAGTERWEDPGDISQFRSIKIGTKSEPTTRFIRKENYLEARAIQIGWDFSRARFMERSRLRSLVATVSAENLFRLSSVEIERGITYPFARAITFKLTTSF